MLEMPRKSGSKLLSHMLTSHAGEIFIHTLNISRSVLEDPPSVTESKLFGIQGKMYIMYYMTNTFKVAWFCEI